MPRQSDKNKKPLSYLSDNFIFTHRHLAVKPCIAKKQSQRTKKPIHHAKAKR